MDPGTPEGKQIISKMVAGLADEEKINMKQENIVEFRDNIENAVNHFFGNALHTILVAHDDNGVATQTENLLIEPNLCPTQLVVYFSQQVWGNADGDSRINSN